MQVSHGEHRGQRENTGNQTIAFTPVFLRASPCAMHFVNAKNTKALAQAKAFVFVLKSPLGDLGVYGNIPMA